MRLLHGLVAFATLAGCTVTLASCGSSGASSSSGSSGSSGSINIAMIAPLTGAYTPIGSGNVAGAREAVAQINAQGGINGRKLVLDVQNDGTDPAQSRTLARNIVNNSKYVAIVGSGFSSSALADEPLAEQAGLPYVSMAASAAQVQPPRTEIWQMPPTSLVAAESIASYLERAGLTRVAVLQDDGGFGAEGAADVKKIAPTYHLTVVSDTTFSLDATDFTSELTALKSSGANAIWLWNVTPQAVTVTKEFRQLRLPQQLVLTHGNPTPQYLQPACPQDNGVVLGSTFAQVASPISLTKLPASNPSSTLAEHVNSLLGSNASQFSYDGYTGVLFLAMAMKQGGVSRSGITKTLTNATYTGPEGVYRFTPSNHGGIGPDSIMVEHVVNCKLKVAPGENLGG